MAEALEKGMGARPGGRLVPPALVTLCVLLGGASAAGVIANLVLQLLAIAALCWALARPVRRWETPVPRRFALLVGAICLLPLLHLVPLPPSVWTALPGREAAERGFAIAGLPLPWMPLNLTPEDCLAAGLSLVPALAVGFWILRSGGPATGLFAVIAALAVLSALVGLLQVSQGRGSPFYLYEITNRGAGVGFFSNRNHLATLMLMALPCIAALASGARGEERSGGKLALLGASAAFLILGITLSQSLAGIALLAPALVGCWLILRNRRLSPASMAAAAAACLIAAVALHFIALAGSSARELPFTDLEGRTGIFAATLKLVGDHFPWGSGLGSFLEVYRMGEDPTQVTRRFVNQAHNDYLQLVLEGGLAAVMLILLFLGWWARTSYRLWQGALPWAKAASVASALVLVHSAVDYPLRTAAIMAIFGACCALMLRGLAQTDRSRHRSA